MQVNQDAQNEYESVGESIRHIQNIYFAHLTVFVTATAGLVALTLGSDPVDGNIGSLIKFFGLLFSGAFWINSEIFLDRSARFQARAVELEAVLGYRLYSALPQNRIKIFRFRWLRPGMLAWNVLYGTVTLFWLVTAYQSIA